MRWIRALLVSLVLHAVLVGAAAMAIHYDAYGPEPDALTVPAAAGDSFLLPSQQATTDTLLEEPSMDTPERTRAADVKPVTASPPVSRGAAAASEHAPGRAPSTAAEGGARASPAAQPSGGPESNVPSLFGAAGDRSAVDLATAFVRAFPQATSADPGWSNAALGSAGDVTVALTLNESGTIVSHQVHGIASATMHQGVERTLSLLRARSFTAKSAVTTLHLACNVSADAVHDGLHGDVFAIGASFVGGEGNGFFALAIGRRVDVTARLAK